MKKNILIFCDYYLPGFRSGGPVRSVVAIVDALKNDADITIVTRNHDCGVKTPYEDITPNIMTKTEDCRILYLSPRKILPGIFDILEKESFDIIYFNSFFSPLFSLFPLFLIKTIFTLQSKIMLAPRGELAVGSLKIKSLKKRVFLLFKKLVIPKNVFWHATSTEEKKDIQKIMGCSAKIIPLVDIAIHGKKKEIICHKHKDEIKIVFISRIAEIKNLDYAVNILSPVSGAVQFDIYGPLEDVAYWEGCQALIAKLPSNITVNYRGELDHPRVADTLREYDLFLLPTLNENYGHAIVEALSVGCPVMISTNTPWKNLSDQQAGWAFDLSNPAAFSEKINELIALDNATYKSYQEGAMQYFSKHINNSCVAEKYKNCFLN